ncbi:MAG: hemerythrin domain-containing protein [Gammaproteobacteria bacterium]|nr:hemerythrin domain-containing protein [Gammaproteobacteria bacterium]
MSTIAGTMTADHRHCDEYFSETEAAISAGEWIKGEHLFKLFREATLNHFAMEEERLFPAFEGHVGHTMGPTQIMRMEHNQMRQLVDEMAVSLKAQDKAGYLGRSETLMMIMQQHNMKEEQMLYPMMDQALGQAGASIASELVPV